MRIVPFLYTAYYFLNRFLILLRMPPACLAASPVISPSWPVTPFTTSSSCEGSRSIPSRSQRIGSEFRNQIFVSGQFCNKITNQFLNIHDIPSCSFFRMTPSVSVISIIAL